MSITEKADYLKALAETAGLTIKKMIVIGNEPYIFTHEGSNVSTCIETLEAWLYEIGKLSPFSIVYAERREYYADNF